MEPFRNLGDLIRLDSPREKIAIIDTGAEGSTRGITFGQIDDFANGVARALTAKGLSRGERVAILAANSAEYLAAIYGIMRAGLVAVPVNFKFPRGTIRFILADSGAKLVFCDMPRRADCPENLPIVQFGKSFADFLVSGDFTPVKPHDREPAMFLYTSGSTGVPKGVVLSHQSHLWVVETRLEGQALSRHRFLIAAPLYHMNALALAQLASAGHATIVLLPQFTACAYIDAIQRYRCTWLTAVPPMIAMMLRDPAAGSADFSSVENLRMGSAPVSESLLSEIHAALPNATVSNAYGTTEGGPVVFGPHPDGIPTPALSVGTPHKAVQLRLAGCPDPSQGVLEMKCPALMNGYHNRPDIVLHMTKDGFYVTCDVFRRDENGFYFFVGRTDDMFVSGGENIHPGDVERILETHPAIAQACVVPIADDIKGTKPVAFIVLKSGHTLNEKEIKQYALAHAPAYQHPRHVWFLEKLPLTSTNKLDRTALMRLAVALDK